MIKQQRVLYYHALFILFFFVALFVFTYFTQNRVNFSVLEILSPPSRAHWFGTDEFGRDVFFRLGEATQTSFTTAFTIVLLSYIFGMLLGVIAGGCGGKIDWVISRIIDIFASFPSFILAIVITGTLGGGIANVILSLVIVYTPYYTRLVRTQILNLKNENFVCASYLYGVPTWYRFLHYFFKLVQVPLLSFASLNLGNVILSISSLSFLGIGVKVPQAELGAMLNEGRNTFETAPWLTLFPSIIIMLIIIYTNFLSKLINERLNPQQN